MFSLELSNSSRARRILIWIKYWFGDSPVTCLNRRISQQTLTLCRFA